MARYGITSPYFSTNIEGFYLDVMTNRSIPARDSDTLVTLSSVYNHRPDLLAYDLYGDSRLWWVFAMRNPNTLSNPLNDFETGAKIYVPTIQTLQEVLGV